MNIDREITNLNILATTLESHLKYATTTTIIAISKNTFIKKEL
jgi:hypothetical protein